MRTTLTIDDDLAGILRRRARELGKPFKELVNSALRKGLAENLDPSQKTVVVRPHDFGNIRDEALIETMEILSDPQAMKAIRDFESGKMPMKPVECLDED